MGFVGAPTGAMGPRGAQATEKGIFEVMLPSFSSSWDQKPLVFISFGDFMTFFHWFLKHFEFYLFFYIFHVMFNCVLMFILFIKDIEI